ncbi:MAG: SWIM zinc finger family protein [Mycobacteriaceae bacterium]
MSDWERFGRTRRADGIRLRSARGPVGDTWWGRRLTETMEAVVDSGRVSRGKSYARSGQVLSLLVEAGRAVGRVQGSEESPYAAEVRLRPFGAEDRAIAAQVVAASPQLVAGLLAGELPQGLAAALASAGVGLLPESTADVDFDCSCLDWGWPCKHAAALVYLLAERLDDDPLQLLALRGVDLDQLLAPDAPAAEPALADCTADFFSPRAPVDPVHPSGNVFDERNEELLRAALIAALPVGPMAPGMIDEAVHALRRVIQ